MENGDPALEKRKSAGRIPARSEVQPQVPSKPLPAQIADHLALTLHLESEESDRTGTQRVLALDMTKNNERGKSSAL